MVEVVADDVEVAGGGELVEGFVDAAFAQGFGGGAGRGGSGADGWWSARGCGRGWRSQSTRNMPPAAMAPCWAGSPMSRRLAPVVAAMVMSASRSRSDRVDASSIDEDRARVEGKVARVGVGEVPGDGLALDAGRGGEGAGGFALHGGADDPVAGGGPGVGAGGDGGGLAGAGAADRGLEAVAALAPLGHELSLLVGEVRVLGERGVDVRVGDEVRAAVQALGEPGGDAVLDVEHLDGGEQRLVARR